MLMNNQTDAYRGFTEILGDLAPVVQRLDDAIHRMNLYPVDSAVRLAITYPLGSDLVIYSVIRPLYKWALMFKCPI